MKHKWYLALIGISLAALMSSTIGCITIVRQEPESSPEQLTSPPTVKYFAASPTSINQGEGTTLSWDVSGADTIDIQPEIGTAGPSGSLQLTPGASVTYTLTAANEAGSVTSTTSISVTLVITGKPDLVITDLWLAGSQVIYKIANIGHAESEQSQTYLYVNSLKQAEDRVGPLAAGKEITTSFSNFEWKFPAAGGGPEAALAQFNVKVCADAGNAIDEIDKGNNCMSENWGLEFTYDFLQNAHLAEWRSGAAIISWPRFAGSQQGAVFIEGNGLIMCPEQVSNGWIQGKFSDFYYHVSTQAMRSSLLEVPENARFTAQVSFKSGTKPTDGVKIAFGYLDEAGGVVLFPKMELYPGDKSRAYMVDLSHLAGKKTEFVLRVEARNSPGGDCVRWVEPKIIQE